MRLALGLGLLLLAGCGTIPTQKMEHYDWPKDRAFIGEPKRAYTKLGLVKTKVNYKSLDPDHDEDTLCKNYFKKAVQDLVKRSHDHGGDAVMDVRSVTFFEDGTSKAFKDAQCVDDGQEGQVLAEGIAIKWAPEAENGAK